MVAELIKNKQAGGGGGKMHAELTNFYGHTHFFSNFFTEASLLATQLTPWCHRAKESTSSGYICCNLDQISKTDDEN